MSSITITDAIDFALRGADTTDLDNLRLTVERALYGREEAIAEQIVSEVVRQFGVDEDAVRDRLSRTGMSVPLPEFTSALDEAEGEIEEDEDDEDEADALFTEPDEDTRQPESAPEQTSGDDLTEAVAALIRAITARLA